MGRGSGISRSVGVVVVAIAMAVALAPAHGAPSRPVLVSHRAAAAPASANRPNAALAPCTDNAYTFDGSHWTSTMHWSFRATSTPKGIDRTAAQAALKRAAGNVVSGSNDCGLADRISATQQFEGRITAGPNVRDDGTCGTPDGRSVIGFGALPPSEIGLTCWWTRGGDTVEADTKLNRAVYDWVARIGAGCVNAWSIEGVATHELGHAFGLNHVAEAVHGNLTMSPLILPCQNSEATLGLGDVRGLEARY